MVRTTVEKERIIEPICDRLAEMFGYRITYEEIPKTFRRVFQQYEDKFSTIEIHHMKMGYAEEIGDVVYQVLKLIMVSERILLEEKQKKLYDTYKSKISSSGFSVDIDTLYQDAIDMIDEKMIGNLADHLGWRQFPKRLTTAANFLANQYVSYISRSMHPELSGGAYHTAEYIKNDRISEETAELIDILTCPSRVLTGMSLVNDMEKNMKLAEMIIMHTKCIYGNQFHTTVSGSSYFTTLDKLLKEKARNDMTLQDVLDFTLFKIRGRQELNFMGYVDKEVKRICKPLEYMLEAGLVKGIYSNSLVTRTI